MILPRTPSFSLDGRRALVTGASSGIGLAAAAALAEQGAHVVLAARAVDRLEEACDALRAAGHSADMLPLDVADVAATAAAVAERGPFAILVNSAGVARHAPAAETAPGDFDTVMALNLRGAYFLTQAVAKGLIDAKRTGSLINISSQMGHVGGIDRAVYCASKHAVEGFTKAMAIEWGRHGIRVQYDMPDLHTNAAHRGDVRRSRARGLAPRQDQARARRRGRGHHGCGRSPGLRRRRADHGNRADGRWRLDGRLNQPCSSRRPSPSSRQLRTVPATITWRPLRAAKALRSFCAARSTAPTSSVACRSAVSTGALAADTEWRFLPAPGSATLEHVSTDRSRSVEKFVL